MHGQGQKIEQKPKTKKFVGFHNHFPLLSMVCFDSFVIVFADGNYFPRYTLKRIYGFSKTEYLDPFII